MSNANLIQAIATTASMVGHDLSDLVVETMARKLRHHPEADVLAALERCMEEVKGRLALKDVLERLPNQPVGVEAAWEIAMKSRLWDESVTVVVPQAVFDAFPFALWDAGDKVGARMAFKDAYQPSTEVKVVLGYSEVRDGRVMETNRAAAIDAAVQQGLITEAQRARYVESTEQRRLERGEGGLTPLTAIGGGKHERMQVQEVPASQE